MKFIKTMVVAFFLMTCGVAQAGLTEGKDYTLVRPPQPTSTNKIEVMEFFFYGCIHCYHLDPKLQQWEKSKPKDVQLILVPTIFRDSWEPMARTYYALDSLGLEGKLHDALFRAWNVENTALLEESAIVNFVSARGVDGSKFSAAYNSFSVQSRVNRSMQMIRSYGIEGTPTMIVNGKYKISGLQPDETIRVLNEVIAMARKER